MSVVGSRVIPNSGAEATHIRTLSHRELASTPVTDESGRWLRVLQAGLGHVPYRIEAIQHGGVVGVLPLALVKSMLFGRYLVSLPYVNTAGPVSSDPEIEKQLIDRAVQLADDLQVCHLELRGFHEIHHPHLTQKNDSKVLMRLALPTTTEELWESFKSKLRSQIRSGQKHNFEIAWGGQNLLAEFYAVFSRNMRDLGTPVFPRRLFAAILAELDAEFCVVRLADKPIASALLIHDLDCTEVPSASSLREHNAANPNMVLYWELLKRAIQRGQKTFDFGRSTVDSGTFKFKQQWGAKPCSSIWQYYVRRGAISDVRPENAKFKLAIRMWQRLPLSLANLLGPMIVRGIP